MRYRREPSPSKHPEHEADRATAGNRGYIDVLWSRVFIGEAKSLGKGPEAAERQARDKQRRNVPATTSKFPYVNGSLNAEPMPIEFFTDSMREAVLAACPFH